MKTFGTTKIAIAPEWLIDNKTDLSVDVDYCISDGEITAFEVTMLLSVLKRIKDPFKLEKLLREKTVDKVMEEKTAVEAAA